MRPVAQRLAEADDRDQASRGGTAERPEQQQHRRRAAEQHRAQFEPGAAHLAADRAVALHHRQQAGDAMPLWGGHCSA